MQQNKYILLALLCTYSVLQAQSEILPLGHSSNNRIQKSALLSGKLLHTSIQPYELRDVFADNVYDSLFLSFYGPKGTPSCWIEGKLFQEHLFGYADDEYSLYADFLPDLQIGYDLKNDRNTILFTRGFSAGGSVGKSFSFYSEFYENQAKFPGYIDSYIDSNAVVPGQGFIKFFGPEWFDYAYSSALFSYRPSQYLGIVAGHGKNFVGDGYRSLLLSDVSFNYPYIKLTADIWKVKYFVMWSEFQNINATPGSEIFSSQKKSGVFHYLDVHISSRFTLGFFEGIIWLSQNPAANRGFEWNYLNPLIFFRPVEFSLGSPDNVLMGLNATYLFSGKEVLYGQFIIDELTINEFVADKGYWANKYGIQLGIKSHDACSIPGLFLQSELNLASPYTYSHKVPLQNYGHYRQSLAHPLGANFYEGVGILSYGFDRFELRGQLNYAVYGTDSSLQTSVGQDIFKSYNNRSQDYGNFIGQGIHNVLLYADLKASYVLNPLINLRCEVSCSYRSLVSGGVSSKTLWFNFGIRSSFRNFYYDF